MQLDKDIIVQLNKFLKEQHTSPTGKGLNEALNWLSKFLNYFEKDYKLWLELNSFLIEAKYEDLSEEEKAVLDEQKKFMQIIYQQDFPDIIEIILIYSQRKQFQDQVYELNKQVQQIVLDIMKDKNDFENIFKKLKNEFRVDKNKNVSQTFPMTDHCLDHVQRAGRHPRNRSQLVHRAVQEL